jgi:hypothetical protein
MAFLYTFTTFNNRDMYFNRTRSFTPKYSLVVSIQRTKTAAIM